MCYPFVERGIIQVNHSTLERSRGRDTYNIAYRFLCSRRAQEKSAFYASWLIPTPAHCTNDSTSVAENYSTTEVRGITLPATSRVREFHAAKSGCKGHAPIFTTVKKTPISAEDIQRKSSCFLFRNKKRLALAWPASRRWVVFVTPRETTYLNSGARQSAK